MKFETVIGLEVHAQLNTKTKIFCSCKTEFGAEPNTQCCPVCMGLPGSLPVLNNSVLQKAVLAGLAANCSISNYSKFDRKNYFYPDLPKAYQISQFDKPICLKGYIEIPSGDSTKKVRLNRIHMEEDAGKIIHSELPSVKESYVDLNRAGTPLIEIVSEPDLSSGDEVYSYLTKLKQILRYIGVSDCNMEEGSLRCDVNISIRPVGTEKLGQKVEIKNMNSFKAIKSAIEYEVSRQIDAIEFGDTIVQETRLWNPDKNQTVSMRSKEEAHDYRYFPEPDLPPIVLSEDYVNSIRNSLPELPDVKKARFKDIYQLPEHDATVLTASNKLSQYFENIVKTGTNAKKASNWIMAEVLSYVSEPDDISSFPVSEESTAELLALVEKNVISGKIAKTVFEEMVNTGKAPEDIIEEKGLKQMSDTGELESIITKIVNDNPSQIEDFKNGKTKVVGFFVGLIMKETKGKANPQVVNEILMKKLNS